MWCVGANEVENVMATVLASGEGWDCRAEFCSDPLWGPCVEFDLGLPSHHVSFKCVVFFYPHTFWPGNPKQPLRSLMPWVSFVTLCCVSCRFPLDEACKSLTYPQWTLPPAMKLSNQKALTSVVQSHSNALRMVVLLQPPPNINRHTQRGLRGTASWLYCNCAAEYLQSG